MEEAGEAEVGCRIVMRSCRAEEGKGEKEGERARENGGELEDSYRRGQKRGSIRLKTTGSGLDYLPVRALASFPSFTIVGL